jgi:ABC-type multidrug transport system fused ATPase/permease subunit
MGAERTTPRIDPDTSKGWFRRLLPMIVARRAAFTVVLVTGLVGLALQVSVPMVLRQAVDRSLGDETRPRIDASLCGQPRQPQNRVGPIGHDDQYQEHGDQDRHHLLLPQMRRDGDQPDLPA